MNRVIILSFVLGLAGAALDFFSAYAIIAPANMSTDLMSMSNHELNPFDLAVAVGLAVLGVVLIVSSFFTISSTSMKKMRLSGKLMAVYGVIMIIIGGAMASDSIPMISTYIYSSTAMFIVGILMIANAIAMLRYPPRMDPS